MIINNVVLPVTAVMRHPSIHRCMCCTGQVHIAPLPRVCCAAPGCRPQGARRELQGSQAHGTRGHSASASTSLYVSDEHLSNHVDVFCSPQGREEIQEDDLFTALEKIQQERLGGSMNSSQSTDETVRIAWDRTPQWCDATWRGQYIARYLAT